MASRKFEREEKDGTLTKHSIELPTIEISEEMKEIINSHSSAKAAMSDVDIEGLMRMLPSFIGVYCRDEMPKLTPPRIPIRFCLIMNTSKLNEVGQHWIAILFDPSYEHECNYYDPLGDPPNAEMRAELKRLCSKIETPFKMKLKWNAVATQDRSTWRCGWHCCLFLLRRCLLGQSFKDATGFRESDVHRYQKVVFQTFDEEDRSNGSKADQD